MYVCMMFFVDYCPKLYSLHRTILSAATLTYYSVMVMTWSETLKMQGNSYWCSEELGNPEYMVLDGQLLNQLFN